MMRCLRDPRDPFPRMLTEQFCLVHFRIAQLHVDAGQATDSREKASLSNAATKMLGEYLKLELRLTPYRKLPPPAAEETPRVNASGAANRR